MANKTKNSDKYRVPLQSYLLPVLERDFADGDCIIQKDLAPCHTSKKCAHSLKKRI